MQRLRIEKICNLCYKDDSEEVEANYTFKASVGAAKEMELDLCEKHNKLTMTLSEALDRFSIYGHRVEGIGAAGFRGSSPPRRSSSHPGSSPKGTYECPDPTCNRSFAYKAMLDDHLNIHADEPIQYFCDWPGCKRPGPHKTAHGLRVHKNRMGHKPS